MNDPKTYLLFKFYESKMVTLYCNILYTYMTLNSYFFDRYFSETLGIYNRKSTVTFPVPS